VTTDEVMELRDAAGVVMPVRPIERGGDPWCVSERPGFLEFIVHPDDAFHYLTFGFPVDGLARKCVAVCVHPMVNGIQLQVYDAEHAPGWRNIPGNAPRAVEVVL
jgi:hypothetical protein